MVWCCWLWKQLSLDLPRTCCSLIHSPHLRLSGVFVLPVEVEKCFRSTFLDEVRQPWPDIYLTIDPMWATEECQRESSYVIPGKATLDFLSDTHCSFIVVCILTARTLYCTYFLTGGGGACEGLNYLKRIETVLGPSYVSARWVIISLEE